MLRELLKWGAATMPSAPTGAAFQMHWLSQPARYLLADHQPAQAPLTVRVGEPSDGFDVTVAGQVRVMPCVIGAEIAANIHGPGPLLIALLQGALSIDEAVARGVTVDGDRRAVLRILPRPDPIAPAPVETPR